MLSTCGVDCAVVGGGHLSRQGHCLGGRREVADSWVEGCILPAALLRRPWSSRASASARRAS